MKALKIFELMKRLSKLEEKTKDGEWETLNLASGVTASENGHGGTSGIKYKKIGNHVFVVGSIATEFEGSSILLATLPEKCRPSHVVYRFNALGGSNIARVYVHSNGDVRLEWAHSIKDNSNAIGSINWIAIDVDFWTDLE